MTSDVPSDVPSDMTTEVDGLNDGRQGDDMPTLDADLADAVALGAELRARLDGGALDGSGPVTLVAGTFASPVLAGRVLLADLAHLTALAEHTGSLPDPDRWTLLADDIHLLLSTVRRERDGITSHRDGIEPPTA
jgi:hypothetical protein